MASWMDTDSSCTSYPLLRASSTMERRVTPGKMVPCGMGTKYLSCEKYDAGSVDVAFGGGAGRVRLTVIRPGYGQVQCKRISKWETYAPQTSMSDPRIVWIDLGR
jgi:hypothetical protein